MLTVVLIPAGNLWISCVKNAELSTGLKASAIPGFLSTGYTQVTHSLSTGFNYKLLIFNEFHLYQFVRNSWREEANGGIIRAGLRLALKMLR